MASSALNRGSLIDRLPPVLRWPRALWSAADRLPPWTPLLLVFALAALLRPFVETNTDVSWDITIVEKMLAGSRLYVDIMEVNPPATAYLYFAPVMLAHMLGLKPELMVDAFVLFGAAAAIWLAARILARARLVEPRDGWPLAAFTAAILTVLPAYAFAEREHIAVIAMLPFLATLAVRACGQRPAFAPLVLAGIGAGITIVIKPHFCVAVGFGIMAAAVYAKSWRTLFAIENWIAGAVAALYGVYVVVAFPEFMRDVLPLVQTVYVPARRSVVSLLSRPLVLAWVGTLRVLTLWRPGALTAAPYGLLVAPSFGFFLTYLLQGKGWPYHAYPMVALGFIALAIAWLERRRLAEAKPEPLPAASDIGWVGRIKRMATVAAVPALCGVSFFWLGLASSSEALVEPIRKLKPHPTMLIISSDLSVGHPLVRDLGGTWVARSGHLWITAGVYQQLVENKPDAETKAALVRYALRDRDMLVEDIRAGRPDIIVVERHVFDWYAWAQADPLVAAELQNYREAHAVETYVHLNWNGTLVVLERQEPGLPR